MGFAMSGKTLNATGVARRLGKCRKTFYNMLNDGRFNVLPVPDSMPRRWAIADVDAWDNGTYDPDQPAGG